MYQKILLAVGFGAVLVGAIIFFSSKNSVNDPDYTLEVNNDNYREYLLATDTEALPSVLTNIAAAEDMLKSESSINDVTMVPLELTSDDRDRNVIEKRTIGNDVYELRSLSGREISETYSMFKNDQRLFTADMEYGAEGPILDWRIVDGKPTFTYLVDCAGVCTTDIYHDGSITVKYGVVNPRYLFSFDGNLGFISTDTDGDKIFYNGNFITPAFDIIHTHNCCAVQEILPTVYDNGILVFSSKRGDDEFINEVRLD